MSSTNAFTRNRGGSGSSGGANSLVGKNARNGKASSGSRSDRGRSTDRSYNDFSREQLQAVSELTVRVQKKMKQELGFREIWLPSIDSPARCSIFVTQNYATCSQLLVFVQTSKGIQPGLWGRTLALQHTLAGSMLPYLELAIQNNYGVVVLNPGTNFVMANGQATLIPTSSSPWDHAVNVFERYIRPTKADRICFVAFYNGGVLVKDMLENFDEDFKRRIGSAVFLESTHVVNDNTSEWLQGFLADYAVNFTCDNMPMFSPVSSERGPRGCTSLSSGFTDDKSESYAWTIASMLNATYIFLQACRQGYKEAIRALQATAPNKLVVTVHRARLQSSGATNPVVVIFCAGQKWETTSAQKRAGEPEWNQTFSFPVANGDAAILIQAKDKSFTGARTLGELGVKMLTVAQLKPERRWYTLKSDASRQQRTSSEVELTIAWVHDTFVARSDSLARENQNKDSLTKSNGSIVPPAQQADENSCYLCATSFRLHRKHHCRMCLRAVCSSCSDRLFLKAFGEPQRVCRGCYKLQIMMQKEGKGEQAEQMIEEAIRMSEMTLPPERRKLPERPLTAEDFEMLKVVGRGAFGKVLLVRKKTGKKNGGIFAMKILKKSHIIKNDQVENTKAEQHILKEIDHPYIVRLRFAFQTADKLYLVMDYYPGGSLFYHLRKSKRFSEARTRVYGAQLLTALMHLHEKNIAYRDLKLENILMDKDGHISLTDFGLSKENNLEEGEEEGMRTICGTAEYMAPELLRHQPYSKVVDWWSYGILIYEMLTGKTPFVDKNRRQMFKNIVSSEPVYPPYISAVLRDFIGKLLVRDPVKRLGSGPNGGKDIMDHPFFESIDWDKLLQREITPPYVPQIQGEDDTNYTPPVFQNMEPIDSPTGRTSLLDIAKEDKHFDNFTYTESSLPKKLEQSIF